MTTLTPEDRARLRDLAAKATPGPWEAEWIEADSWWSITGAPYEEYVCPEVATVESGGGDEARYIAAADPATVTALLDALDAAEAAVQRVREQAQGWIDEYYDPVYRDNGWCQGVVGAATEVIRTLGGDA